MHPVGKGIRKTSSYYSPQTIRGDEISIPDAESRSESSAPPGKGQAPGRVLGAAGRMGTRGSRAPGIAASRARRGRQGVGGRGAARVQGALAGDPEPLLTSPNWKAETMVTTTPTKQT